MNIKLKTLVAAASLLAAILPSLAQAAQSANVGVGTPGATADGHMKIHPRHTRMSHHRMMMKKKMMMENKM